MPKNANTLEYLPAADAEVIEPVIDAVLLKESEKNKELSRIKRENPEEPVIKTEVSIVDLITLDNDEVRGYNNDEINECASRLIKPSAKPTKTAAAKTVKVKAEKTDKPASKATKVKGEKTTPEKTKSKTLDTFFSKKKNDSDSDEDKDDLSDESVTERVTSSRAKKATTNYVDMVDSDSEEESSKRSRTKKSKVLSTDDDISDVNNDSSLHETKPKKVNI